LNLKVKAALMREVNVRVKPMQQDSEIIYYHESPNSPPTTNYCSIKPYSNPSGPTVYNSGALISSPTLKFWNDSNLRSCASLWTPHGTSLIHSSEGTSAALQPKKKSAVIALTMVIDFAPIPIISQ
jgi:hypothetical protein